MLETKLEELKAELSELRAVIVELTSAMRSAPAPTTAPTTAPVEAKPEPVADPIKTERADPEPVNRDDLQDLCMTIVRSDRAKKAAVKDAIAAFGGASTLKDVPESDLVALKAALEALV